MSKLNRRWLVPIALAICAIAGILLWAAFPHRQEPVYAGKPESYWAAQLTNAAAFELQSSSAGLWGTNYVPFLFSVLQRRESAATSVYRRLWPRMPLWIRARWALPPDARLVQREAAGRLSSVGDTGILIQVLKAHPDPEVRALMVRGLSTKSSNVGVTALLLKALDDADKEVRMEAVYCLGEGNDWDLAKTACLKGMQDTDREVRLAAIGIPKKMAENSPEDPVSVKKVRELVPGLVKAVHDQDSEIRDEAVKILGRFAPTELVRAQAQSGGAAR